MDTYEKLIFLAEQIAQYAEQAGRFDRATKDTSPNRGDLATLTALRDEARVMLAAVTREHTRTVEELREEAAE